MKNDKTKTIVVSVLGVVLLGVGAFQFMPKGSAPVATATETYAADEDKADGKKLTPEEKKAEEERAKQEALIAVLGGPLAARDPFAASGISNPLPDNKVVPPTVPPPTARPSGGAASAPRPRSSGGSSGYRPPSMSGGIPPYDPTGGNGLPAGGGPIAGIGPSYAVSGVITGDRPMAVFKDSQGNQRIVPLGGQVDADTKVVGIERGKVRVKTRDGEQTLTLEGQGQ